MRPSTPLDFPGSRYVAGWWKQLAPLRPRALWVAHLPLHRVEASVRTSQVHPLDPLTRLLLQALGSGETTAGLGARLCVRAQLVARMLRQAQDDGLVQGCSQGCWTLTALGRQALKDGAYTRLGQERRVFHFVKNEAGRPPQFLKLLQPCATPLIADCGLGIADSSDNPQSAIPNPQSEAWTFDVGLLRRCMQQPPDWKEQHGFPRDVHDVVDSAVTPAGRVAWQSVVLAQPEYLAAAVVLAPAEQGDRLLGYALEPERWILHAQEAAFLVQADWPAVFPDLAAEPSPEQWREAWRGWCQRRGLPTVEAEACVLERHDHLVRVRAPNRLLDRLRSARSEALKGEAWLLAGTGRVRKAAQVEVSA